MKTQFALFGVALILGINTGSFYSNENNLEIWRSTKSGIAITNSLSMNVDQARAVFGNMIEEKDLQQMEILASRDLIFRETK